jgi:hypothetical protein
MEQVSELVFEILCSVNFLLPHQPNSDDFSCHANNMLLRAVRDKKEIYAV